jgi:oxygen-independent coproporphyrinogen-3 oxidase
MRIDRLALAESKVPRYTSYPTAAQFSPSVGAAELAGWLGSQDPKLPASLYVHVPFCRKLCLYCGCNTSITSRAAPVARFLDALAREIDIVAALLPGRLSLAHLHLGGGTPSILEAGQFATLMARLRARFDLAPGAEIAIEADPRGLDAARIAAFAAEGVTRVSLGVQDLDPDVQRAIDRLQPLEMVAAATAALRAAGLGRIAMDLVYGLPRQTVATIERTVGAVAALAPDRVALFGYAHVPWIKPHQRLLEPAGLPGAAERLELCDAATRSLRAAGYVAVGIDHFARPEDPLALAARQGALGRNFQGYTTDSAGCLIGLGPSAISSFAQGIAQNATRSDDWATAIAAGMPATCRGVRRRDDGDRRRGRIIERLMCDFAVDLAADIAADPSLAAILDGLGDLAACGLVRRDGSRLAIPADAHGFARVVAARFDAYLAPAATRHAMAV